jgi:hypothetical protein
VQHRQQPAPEQEHDSLPAHRQNCLQPPAPNVPLLLVLVLVLVLVLLLPLPLLPGPLPLLPLPLLPLPPVVCASPRDQSCLHHSSLRVFCRGGSEVSQPQQAPPPAAEAPPPQQRRQGRLRLHRRRSAGV